MVKDFPGTLFLVVGNSGSGKDSIIEGVIEKYPSDMKEIYIPQRYITRPPSKFEDNYSISAEKFHEMEENGEFALKWHIYHLYYGVPSEIDEWLKKGHPVVVNVSRTIIQEARSEYKHVRVIFIEVPFEITLKRIKKRGREDGELLQERIDRAKTHQKMPSADFIVDNSGNLENAVDQFLFYIIETMKRKDNRNEM